MSKKHISLPTSISIVIANMIGTGVFTSLGFQVLEIQSVFALITLWLVGGIVALFGALCYSELAASMPRSGGEYHYLSKIYHPSVGFASGFISLIVGFAAPVALAAMAFGSYLSAFTGFEHTKISAIIIILILSFVHSLRLDFISKFQNILTVTKVLLILIFVIAGFNSPNHQEISLMPANSLIPGESWKSIFSPAFAISLVFVGYSYSGWNASTYLAGEIRNPEKNIPISIVTGTLVVGGLYVLLNYIFLYTVPIADLKGQIEIGYLSAGKIFGHYGGKTMSGFISILLISSISSMIFAGPRISQAIGEDYSIFSFLSKKNENGLPTTSILFQSGISIVLILSSTFEILLTYVGFLLTFFTVLSVVGIYILRIRGKNTVRPFKTPGYPVVPAIFILINIWVLYYIIQSRPEISIAGLLTILLAYIIYISEKFRNGQKAD